MRVACVSVVLLACCAWSMCSQASDPAATPAVPAAPQQPDPPAGPGVWDEPIHFSTKARDACSMVVSGQGALTKLRVTCRSKGRSYWCDYLGRPDLCRPYSAKPRHYFTQIMWEMRKLHNACQGSRSYKPKMCHAGPAEAQMTFHNSWPRAGKTNATAKAQPSKTDATVKLQPAAKPPKPGKSSNSRAASPRKPAKSTAPPPTEATETPASELAQEYCWKSLQGVCTYIISWFQN